MKIDEIYKYIKDKNIKLIYTNNLKNAKGLYLQVDNVDFILIKANLTVVEESFVLNEEIAHYKLGVVPTNAFDNTYYEKLIRSKNESRAFKYCVNELLPLHTLKSILKRSQYKYEVADELSLPEEFVSKAFDLYLDSINDLQL